MLEPSRQCRPASRLPLWWLPLLVGLPLPAQDAEAWRAHLASVSIAELLAGGASEVQRVSVLLQHDDAALRHDALRLCLQRPESLFPPASASAPEQAHATVLEAYAGSSLEVRDGLGALLRSPRLHLPLPLALRLLRCELRPSVFCAESVPHQGRTFAGLARGDLLDRRRTDSGRCLRALFQHEPEAVIEWLRPQPGPPPADLAADLLARLANRRGSRSLYELLARTPEGSRALRLEANRTRDDSILGAIAVAGSDPLPFVPVAEQRLRELQRSARLPQMPSHGGSRALQQFLACLPWSTGSRELDTLRQLLQELWQQTPAAQRRTLVPLVAACGPGAAFAGDEIAAMLRPTRNAWDGAMAEALLAMGRGEDVARIFEGRPLPSGERGSLLAAADAERRFEACLEAPARTFLPTVRSLEVSTLDSRQRTLLAARLLRHIETTGHRDAAANFEVLWGPFDASIDGEFASFLARRSAGGAKPDLLAEAVVHWTFRALPDHGAAALRCGLVPTRVAVEANRRIPLDPTRLGKALPHLLAVALTQPDGALAHAIGPWLAEAGLVPLEMLCETLAHPASTATGLRILAGLGPPAAAAVEKVHPLLASPDPELRALTTRTLVRLGPDGVEHVTRLAANDRALRETLVSFLVYEDGQTLAAIARWLAGQPGEWRPRELQCLRLALDRARDGEARGWLGQLQTDLGVTVHGQDWLQLGLVEPAAMRAQLVSRFARSTQLSPVALGALAECLFDPDPAVRAAAVEALLADPQRTRTCRIALREFAATASPSLAERIHAALAAAR